MRARWADGQLDDCTLSLRELTKVRDSFANTLRSMMHSRISYTKTEDPLDRKTSGGKTVGDKKESDES